MAVDEESGSGHEAGIHAHGIPGVELDEDEAVPGGAIPFGFRSQFAKETLFELEDFDHPVGGDERLGGGGVDVGKEDVLEFVSSGRQDGGALVDFGGIEEVEDGEMLDGENLVHTFNAEAAFAIEEIRDMGLFESGLLGEAKAGQFARFDALPQDFTKIILQDFELHGRSIAPACERTLEWTSHGRHTL